jgi:hypothetical protein
MMTLPLAFVVLLIAAVLIRSRRRTQLRYSVHVLAVATALVIIAIARAAYSGSLSGCAFAFPNTRHRTVAEVHP